jgi:RNA polymerase sigma-70 factor (ECF subfamily)
MSQKNKDRELRDLYERYSSLIYGRCRYILRSDDDAWDATQDVFIKLMRSLPGIKDRSAIYSWLLSTSTNLCFSMLRRKRGEPFEEDFHSGEGRQLHDEKRAALKEIIATLFRLWDKKVREVVMYSYIYDYSQKEISQLTGLGESTIRKYLTRFKRGSRHAYADFKEAING